MFSTLMIGLVALADPAVADRPAPLPPAAVGGRAGESPAKPADVGKQVDELLRKLQRSHERSVEAARRALLGNPATRDLIDGSRSEATEPMRDFAQCLRVPTAPCLLAEAAANAKAVAEDNLRDWALGELLAAQARAGLADQARATARHIADPRLIMMALRDIAEEEAAAGRTADALAAAGIIPDPDRKTEALIAIAAIQARDDHGAAAKTLDKLRASLARIERPTRRIALMGRIAVVLAAAGNPAEARQTTATAADMALALPVAADRDVALRAVAAAKAETGDPEGALNMLRDVGNRSDVTPILIAAANAQADAGDAAGALKTASGIEAGRYKAVVLSRIALAQFHAGKAAAALATIGKAAAAADSVALPFARDFADSRIALALAEMAASGRSDLFGRSVERANAVADPQLRAQTLWTIATARRRAGDRGGAEATRALAEAATRDMKNPLGRVWMFSDIAIQRNRGAEAEAAWRAFNLGLSAAAKIRDAWDRSRALSRMAVALIDLTEPRPARPDLTERP